jgi:hypothetical protein
LASLNYSLADDQVYVAYSNPPSDNVSIYNS